MGFFGRVALSGEPAHVEEYVEPFGKWLSVSAYSPTPGYLAATFFDITGRRKNENDLRARMDEIERFNRLATAREIRVLELKNRVNDLAVRVGETPPFRDAGGEETTSPPEMEEAPVAGDGEETRRRMTLGDIFDRARMQVLLDSFCDSLGISAAIIDTEGTVFVDSRWQKICTGFLRKDERTYARCIESDTVLASSGNNK